MRSETDDEAKSGALLFCPHFLTVKIFAGTVWTPFNPTPFAVPCSSTVKITHGLKKNSDDTATLFRA
jgi:hypothetical protein